MARDEWLNDYREGSFRGVAFKTLSHTVSGGRRKQDREFAKREVGNSEDLGRKLKTFSMELYVLGSDYFEKRQALEDALDTPGPGELVHPYRGTLQVQAGSYSITESSSEGRIARFTVEFTEAGEVKFPDQVEDDVANTITNAEAVEEESKGFFASVLDTVNQAAFVVQAAADDTAALVDTIEDAVTAVTQPVANLTYAIRNLKADVDDLVKLPGELADRIASVFDDLVSEFENDPGTAERVMGVFVGKLDSTFVPPVGDTPSRTVQKGNQQAVKNLGKELGLANQAKVAVEVPFLSVEAAVQSRNEVVQGLDTQIDVIADSAVTSDSLFQAVKDLQTSITRALPQTGATELIKFTPVQTVPALVIAHNLFENLDKEAEIIDQNAVEHPGFVPGGEEIEVSAL